MSEISEEFSDSEDRASHLEEDNSVPSIGDSNIAPQGDQIKSDDSFLDSNIDVTSLDKDDKEKSYNSGLGEEYIGDNQSTSDEDTLKEFNNTLLGFDDNSPDNYDQNSNHPVTVGRD